MLKADNGRHLDNPCGCGVYLSKARGLNALRRRKVQYWERIHRPVLHWIEITLRVVLEVIRDQKSGPNFIKLKRAEQSVSLSKILLPLEM